MASRVLLVLLLLPAICIADVVEYEFDIDVIEMNITGQPVAALAVGGQIPAPTIRAAVGDVLRATFHNRLKEATSVHWHGILLPGDQDGVPYLNTQPIGPGASHTFEFPITHAGTFWYHSHTNLQIQRGLYGAIVLEEADAQEAFAERVALFSDWSDDRVESILRNLKASDDYYTFDRDNVQSWDRVVANGSEAVESRVRASLSRMPPMDLADVGYDAFLVNGLPIAEIGDLAPGEERLLLRMINGSTSSYFEVEYASGPMTVIAADGQDVEPIEVQRLRISTAETYDVLLPIVSGKASELRATSIDGSGHSSLYIGEGERVMAPDVPRPNLFRMDHGAMTMDMDMHMDMESDAQQAMPVTDAHAAHGHDPMPAATVEMPSHDHGVDPTAATAMPVHDHGAQHADDSAGEPIDVIEHMTDYSALRAVHVTTLPADQPWREIDLSLTGNMERYVWSFDGKTAREFPQILIRKGENVRIYLSNETMMHHPIHLHGHFFRVVNQHGERSPLKHTVNVPPMGRVIIEFDANEEEDWLFHCHNQFHMKTGMNRVVSYEETSLFTPEIDRLIQPSTRWFGIHEFHMMSAFADYEFSLSDERHEFRLEIDSDLADTYELHAIYDYHFNRFTSGFIGMESREHHHDKNHNIAIAGFNIMLPLLIDSEWRVSDHGKFRLQLQSEIQMTKRFVLDWRWNSDNERRYGINYRLNNRWSLTVHTDTEYGDGVGVKFFY